MVLGDRQLDHRQPHAGLSGDIGDRAAEAAAVLAPAHVRIGHGAADLDADLALALAVSAAPRADDLLAWPPPGWERAETAGAP